MKKSSNSLREATVFSWRDKSNFAELVIFILAGVLMSIFTDDFSFTVPMYAAYVLILLKNLYSFWKTKNDFVLYKILFYSILIPDNYIVMVALILFTIYSCVRHKGQLVKFLDKKIVCVLICICAFFAINIILSERLWFNVAAGFVYASVFPAAYVFCKLDKDKVKDNFENLVKFDKGLVAAEIICVTSFIIFNFQRVISGIDNDWLAGTFGGRHGNLLLFFMIFSILLIEKHYREKKNKKDLVYIILLVILSIFTNSVALTVMFFIAYIVGSIIKAKNFKSVALSFGIVIISGLVFFFVASPQWVQSYLIKLQDFSYLKEGIPKIITYEETFVDIPRMDKKFLIIGNGVGQYSSRGALLATGEYIPGIRGLFDPSISEYTERYILARYKHYNVELSHGTMYSPYSSIITLFGEYGLIGLVGFCVAIFIMIRRSKKEAAIFVIFFFLSCFIENYIEFAKVTIPLFLLYFMDQRGADD